MGLGQSDARADFRWDIHLVGNGQGGGTTVRNGNAVALGAVSVDSTFTSATPPTSACWGGGPMYADGSLGEVACHWREQSTHWLHHSERMMSVWLTAA